MKLPRPEFPKRKPTKKEENPLKKDPEWRKAHYLLFRNQRAVEATNCGLLDAYFTNSLQSNETNEDDHAEEILPDQALFAIFDGHTGRGAVDFLKQRFLKEYVLPSVRNATTVEEVIDALRVSFVRADLDFLDGALKDNDIERGLSGACVLVTYLRRNLEGRNYLFVANAGDCRAVLLSREPLDGSDETSEIKETLFVANALSRDHQAGEPSEEARLKREHPDEKDVVKNGRVKGYLEPSRGIGDGRYKIDDFNTRAARPRPDWHPPYTTAEPEVSFHELADEDSFVIMGTDGLWGTLNNSDVAEFLEAHERANRLRLNQEWTRETKLNDPDLYANVKHMTKVRNPATALIVESLRTAAMEWPHRADYSGDGLKKGIPTEMRMTLLPPKERRRLYDDTTITVAADDEDDGKYNDRDD